MNDFKVLVIHRRTTYAEMSEGTDHSHIAGLVQSEDAILDKMLAAHKAHDESMKKIKSALQKRGIKATWRHDFSGLLPDSFDLVITVGGDGTVLHASHSIGRAPILAINSSPESSTGYFTAGTADEFPTILERIISHDMDTCKLYRMEVKVNGEVVNSRVLNDVLFSNACPASTTRYELRCAGKMENQISSGVWISTAAGSTAAIRAAGGTPMNMDSDKIQYAVREPCPGGGQVSLSLPKLINGTVDTNESFAIRSTSSSAMLFIDGPHVVVPVNFGDIITVSGGAPPIVVFGDLAKNKT